MESKTLQKIRLLKAGEIECRAASVSEKGVSLLLYKDARVDQRILDETFGPFGWKRSHQCIDGNLYCTVEIFDKERKEWVAKQDVGTCGYAEKEKTQASDSFKRACFNWGIGRELYSAPFIWIPASKTEIRKKENGYFCTQRFSVSEITYTEDREIANIRIVDGKGSVVFERITEKPEAGKKAKADDEEKVQPKKKLTKAQLKKLAEEMHRTGVGFDRVSERYSIEGVSDLTPELYAKVMNALKKTKDAA